MEPVSARGSSLEYNMAVSPPGGGVCNGKFRRFEKKGVNERNEGSCRVRQTGPPEEPTNRGLPLDRRLLKD